MHAQRPLHEVLEGVLRREAEHPDVVTGHDHRVLACYECVCACSNMCVLCMCARVLCNEAGFHSDRSRSVRSDGDLSCSDRPVLFVALARVLAVHDEGVLRVIRACVETDGIRV